MFQFVPKTTHFPISKGKRFFFIIYFILLESPFLFDCTAVHMSCKCNSSLTDETLHSYTTLGTGCAERRIIPVQNISREIMISAGREFKGDNR